MKILQVSHGFPPEQSGGVERYTWQITQALQARGHELAVFSRIADWHLPEYTVQGESLDGLPVFRINNTWRLCASFEESYHHPTIARRFGELLDHLRPDLVHLQHLVHLSTHIPDEAHKRRIPVVMTLHDYWLLCNQGQLFRQDRSICTEAITGTCTDCAGLWLGMGTQARHVVNVLERWWPEIRYKTSRLRRLAHRYYRLTQRRPGQQKALNERMRARRAEMLRLVSLVEVGVVPSLSLFNQLVAYGWPATRLVHIPHGIPTGQLVAVNHTRGSALRVAYLSRVMPAKGIHVLLEAVDQLRDTDIQIHIHGDIPPYGDIDEYAQQMRRRATRNPRIRWHGAYGHDALTGILAETDVVVVPSLWNENQPLVILEAFAARTPVVATDLGGMRELVRDGQNGLLFPRGDAKALARCLARLAEDQALCERLRQGIGPVKDVAEHAQELEALYERLLVGEVPPLTMSRGVSHT